MSKHTENQFDDELSNRRENLLTNQLSKAVENSGIKQIGESRHDLKQDRYNALADAGEKADSHNVNKGIGITSYASLHRFQSNTMTFGRWCFGTENLNSIYQIKPEHVAKFLTEACDREYAKNSVQSFAASIEKLAVVLDRVAPIAEPRSETWHEAVKSCKAEIAACPEKDTETRAYADPRGMIDAMDSPQMQMIATMQLDYGLRIGDATKIDAAKIDGSTLVFENSKNGQDLRIELKAEDVEKINALADADGKISVRQSDYAAALKDACHTTGQTWTGTHGLRHNYAQDRMDTLTSEGKTWTQALYIVSEEMGHHRVDITLTYLR